jgi:hypothetical protein
VVERERDDDAHDQSDQEAGRALTLRGFARACDGVTAG